MNKKTRRDFIKIGLLTSLLAPLTYIANAVSAILTQTPRETAGPFYPIISQQDKDFDLTRIEGNSDSAKGEVIIIEGSVVDTEGKAIKDVSVELWQANNAERYSHPYDSNPVPLDPNFQGWAIAFSGQEGGFRFKTIMSGAYAVSANWLRPPHIHYKISKRGYKNLTSQMYFLHHPLNDIDALIQRKSSDEQLLMMAKKSMIKDNVDVYQYQIVLEKE
jgi:protocatechuate 3,4-dioxygenase beta subunit